MDNLGVCNIQWTYSPLIFEFAKLVILYESAPRFNNASITSFCLRNVAKCRALVSVKVPVFPHYVRNNLPRMLYPSPS